MLISILYNIFFIYPSLVLIKILKLILPKLKDRENNWKSSLNSITSIDSNNKNKRIWFHAASMGEFEQAKPIIEKIKELVPDTIIICSFFSPSGYNNQKNYKFSDAVCYLPFDTLHRAKKFIDLVKPDLAVFVRYDVWLNHLKRLVKNQVPIFLIDATIPKSKFMQGSLMKPYLRAVYGCFSMIFTVGSDHSHFFENLSIKSDIHTTADTRFDRIINSVEIAAREAVLPAELFDDYFVLVAGSSWQPDEDIIINSYHNLKNTISKKLKLIFVPHEPTEEHIEQLQEKISETLLLSDILSLISSIKSDLSSDADLIAELCNYIGERHIIVDSIGKLLNLYSIADAAYVGGAFGVGIHSVTEPAGYGLPVATGTKIQGSPDALALKELGALTIVQDDEDLQQWLYMMIESIEEKTKAGSASRDYVYKAKGASEVVVKSILKSL
jgi:3-deoxy-D-manno-octulosonic-acid transferase